MMRLFCILLISFLFFSCDSNPKKKVKIEKESAYLIPSSFFRDRKIFPKLTHRYKKAKRKEIEDFFKQTYDSDNFNGAFLVAKNGQVIYEKYAGYSNYQKKDVLKYNTALHMASIGKVLTATAIFRLIETNKLELDQLVNTILPTFPYETVTIRMLLNHRSGVPKYANFTSLDSIWNIEKTLSNKDILDLLAKHKFPLDFKPDSKFTYNNTNFALLALVIEELTKNSFSQAMKSLVFDPIGMNNSFVMELKKDSGSVSQSYKSTYEKIPFDYLDAIYGDKNIYSTARDMMRFDQAMQREDFVSKKLQKEIYKGYSYERAGVKNYGLGIRMKEWETGQSVFYHTGWWHGNTGCFVTLKKEKVTIIIISSKFTRRVYDVIRLSSLFGDYPFSLVNEEDENQINFPLKEINRDSLSKKPNL